MAYFILLFARGKKAQINRANGQGCQLAQFIGSEVGTGKVSRALARPHIGDPYHQLDR